MELQLHLTFHQLPITDAQYDLQHDPKIGSISYKMDRMEDHIQLLLPQTQDEGSSLQTLVPSIYLYHSFFLCYEYFSEFVQSDIVPPRLVTNVLLY